MDNTDLLQEMGVERTRPDTEEGGEALSLSDRASATLKYWDGIHKSGSLDAIYLNSYLQDRLNDRMMDRIIGYLKPSANSLFLDAGCGGGDHLVRIANRGYRCTGVDFAETALKKARQIVAKQGIESRVVLSCQSLEDLAFPDNSFDSVHCRGVLMHIMNWEKALANLCRVLKPGGRIAIVEANCKSLDAGLVRMVRLASKRKSRLVRTECGMECWFEEDGVPMMLRSFDMTDLCKRLKALDVTPKTKFATECLGIGRFPGGILRTGANLVNRFWFSLNLPYVLSNGVAIIGEKNQ